MASWKPVTGIVIGAGSRGSGYPHYALYWPQLFKVVGVAEPRDFYRNRMQKEHNITDSYTFNDWQEAAACEKFADCVLITTPDRLHKDPAIAFAQKGYNILLEKPMAVSDQDCRDIVKACKTNGVILGVCHVMRYVPWAQKLKELVDSGIIGEVVNIQHTEPIGFWHFAHSYVRGNWRNEETSSSSLMAKGCHNMDFICYLMGNKRCVRVSSFGHLSHFRKEDKPPGAASRCMECPEQVECACPYSAKRLYIGSVKEGKNGWPVNVITEVADIESVTNALKTGPYGRCVYECDNDVMSNQIVNMQFAEGQTATLTMMAFTKRLCASETKIYGTKGELTCDASLSSTITHFDFVTEQTSAIPIHRNHPPGQLAGHGGADYNLIQAFIEAVANNDPSKILTGPDETLASHLLVFAAEKARKDNKVVTINGNGTYD